jgi:pilus assembly protein CpaB
MNMKRLAMALLIGLLVSGAGTYLIGRRLTVGANHRAADQRYLAATHPLTAGAVIKAEDVAMVNWPADAPLAGAFTSPTNLVGRTLLYPLDKDQPLTDKLLSAPGAGSGLVGRIPDGMRAIALRTDEVMGVAGFLQPDAHVDVLATIHTDKDPEPMTLIVVQNAEVLAAGHQLQPDPDGKPAVVTVVTLLLSPSDAERAVLASQQGAIHFVLRGGDDQKKAEDGPVDLGELVDGHIFTPVKPKPAAKVESLLPKPAHPTPESVIDTIAGDKKTSETFTAVPK